MSIKKLTQKINQIGMAGTLNQDNVLAIMLCLRSALEKQKKLNKFWHAWLFCTWCAGHHELSRDFAPMLEKICQVIISNQEDDNKKSYNDMMADVFNLKKLKEQLIAFCEQHNIPAYLFDDIRNWGPFSAYLREIIADVKISFPDDLSLLTKEQKGIYEKMASIPNGMGCKAFWVTTATDPTGKFYSYWHVTTFKENIVIQGRLVMNEP